MPKIIVTPAKTGYSGESPSISEALSSHVIDILQRSNFQVEYQPGAVSGTFLVTGDQAADAVALIRNTLGSGFEVINTEE
jgi:hypothetical protein